MSHEVVAENGIRVTDEMIANWESALECDEWPTDWENVGETIEGRLPKSKPDTITPSVKIPTPMKRAIDLEAKHEGKSIGAYVRGVLAASLMETTEK